MSRFHEHKLGAQHALLLLLKICNNWPTIALSTPDPRSTIPVERSGWQLQRGWVLEDPRPLRERNSKTAATAGNNGSSGNKFSNCCVLAASRAEPRKLYV
ncbi:hypothetical protein C8R45DRAFT_1036130 [Mycena sanguinolenta]|nr:hypothetical protein C8R45DRAFT_1036130 [Mycena sanguinolenta]